MTGTICRFFSSFGDLNTAKALIDPDARLIGVRAQHYPQLPLYGTFIGHDGLERFMAGLRLAYEPQIFEIDADIETDTMGFASGRVEHRLRQTGALFRSHWAVMCRFKNGRITLYRFYEETAATEAAFGVRTDCQEVVSHADF